MDSRKVERESALRSQIACNCKKELESRSLAASASACHYARSLSGVAMLMALPFVGARGELVWFKIAHLQTSCEVHFRELQWAPEMKSANSPKIKK